MYGSIARCSLGILGRITSAKPKQVKYPDGNEGVAWTGYAIGTQNPWSSRNPIIVLTPEEAKAVAQDIAG